MLFAWAARRLPLTTVGFLQFIAPTLSFVIGVSQGEATVRNVSCCPGSGFAIGMAQHGLSASQAADNYILLAVGDALVAQIPSLLISVAAAMVVSRVGKGNDLGKQVAQQMFISSRVLGIAASRLASGRWR